MMDNPYAGQTATQIAKNAPKVKAKKKPGMIQRAVSAARKAGAGAIGWLNDAPVPGKGKVSDMPKDAGKIKDLISGG